MEPNITTTVLHCARCGENHEDLLFSLFTNPIEDSDGTVWAYWAMCPITDEPILLRTTDNLEPTG